MNTHNNQHLFADTYYIDQHPTDGTDRETLSHPRTEGDEDAEEYAARDAAMSEDAARIRAVAVEVAKQKKLWRTLDVKERRERRFDDIIATQPITEGEPIPGWDHARFHAEVQAVGHGGIGSKIVELTDEKPAVYDPNGVYDQDNRPEAEDDIEQVPWIGRKAG